MSHITIKAEYNANMDLCYDHLYLYSDFFCICNEKSTEKFQVFNFLNLKCYSVNVRPLPRI